jgi:hypothetical protein
VEERRLGLRRSERLVEKPWKRIRLARGCKKGEKAQQSAGHGAAAKRRRRGHGDALRERGKASAVPQFAKSCHRPFLGAPKSGAT